MRRGGVRQGEIRSLKEGGEGRWRLRAAPGNDLHFAITSPVTHQYNDDRA
jgi:hypothetical protein